MRGRQALDKGMYKHGARFTDADPWHGAGDRHTAEVVRGVQNFGGLR